MGTVDDTRRRFMLLGAAAGAALVLDGNGNRALASPAGGEPDEREEEAGEGGSREVLAVEDLMREHGVLRRALLVYVEVADRLRRDPGRVPPGPLHDAAELFRHFGEDYHERTLEEGFIFPAVRGAGGPAAAYPDLLIAQHERGREVIDYILTVTAGGRIGGAAVPLADSLDALLRMYANHAAREDTIVFPAWKQTLTDSRYAHLSEEFEEIEERQLGAGGYEGAVDRIAAIERQLGLADIGQFTAPPPPSMTSAAPAPTAT